MREDMRNDSQELPEQGQAKNIMSRFKSMESENQSQVRHTPSKIASKVLHSNCARSHESFFVIKFYVKSWKC